VELRSTEARLAGLKHEVRGLRLEAKGNEVRSVRLEVGSGKLFTRG
jgi:hypothetical protein